MLNLQVADGSDTDTVAPALVDHLCNQALERGAHRLFVRLPERDALTMAYNAIENGAAGVDMGRNIFQSDTPQAMIRAVGAVVHESAKPEDAYEQYLRNPAPVG